MEIRRLVAVGDQRVVQLTVFPSAVQGLLRFIPNPAFAAQQDMQPAVAEPPALIRQFPQPRTQSGVVGALRAIADRAPVRRNDGAPASQRPSGPPRSGGGPDPHGVRGPVFHVA
jgi:hypothetical protein